MAVRAASRSRRVQSAVTRLRSRRSRRCKAGTMRCMVRRSRSVKRSSRKTPAMASSDGPSQMRTRKLVAGVEPAAREEVPADRDLLAFLDACEADHLLDADRLVALSGLGSSRVVGCPGDGLAGDVAVEHGDGLTGEALAEALVEADALGAGTEGVDEGLVCREQFAEGGRHDLESGRPTVDEHAQVRFDLADPAHDVVGEAGHGLCYALAARGRALTAPSP